MDSGDREGLTAAVVVVDGNVLLLVGGIDDDGLDDGLHECCNWKAVSADKVIVGCWIGSRTDGEPETAVDHCWFYTHLRRARGVAFVAGAVRGDGSRGARRLSRPSTAVRSVAMVSHRASWVLSEVFSVSMVS
jgi:hypothetical protein